MAKKVEKMADIVMALCPHDYYRQLFSRGARSDGRRFDEFRPVVVQSDVISTSAGSSMIRVGDSLIIASIRSELGRPLKDHSDQGKAEVRVLSSTKSEHSSGEDDFYPYANVDYCCDLLQSLLDDGLIVDLKHLSIEKGKLCWILTCDVVIIDGAVSLDGCLAAMLAAFNCVMLPNVVLKCPTESSSIAYENEQKMEIEETDEEDEDSLFTPERIQIEKRNQRRLNLARTKPVAALFAFLPLEMIGNRASAEDVESNCVILADPSVEEIKALGNYSEIGTAAIVVGENSLCGLYLNGVGSFTDSKLLDRCLNLARSRRKLINRLINEVSAEKK